MTAFQNANKGRLTVVDRSSSSQDEHKLCCLLHQGSSGQNRPGLIVMIDTYQW